MDLVIEIEQKNKEGNMEKIKRLIEDNLFTTVSEFCKNIDVSRETIANILNNKHKGQLSLLTVKKICRYFNVDFHDYI